jgi:hypothetical protein
MIGTARVASTKVRTIGVSAESPWPRARLRTVTRVGAGCVPCRPSPRGRRSRSEDAERHAQRAVSISFFLLAPYLMVQSLRDLFGGHDVTPNALGLVVTAASLVVMPLLGRAKQRLGTRLGSEATRGEGLQNLMCAAQAAAVLVGLAATATLGWSWLDPAIGLLLAGWAIYEGLEAWRGEDCC